MSWDTFVRLFAERHGLTIRRSRHLLDAAFAELAMRTMSDGRFSVPGFGVFRRRTRKARRVLSPVDGSEIQLPQTIGVGFHKSKNFGGSR